MVTDNITLLARNKKAIDGENVKVTGKTMTRTEQNH